MLYLFDDFISIADEINETEIVAVIKVISTLNNVQDNPAKCRMK